MFEGSPEGYGLRSTKEPVRLDVTEPSLETVFRRFADFPGDRKSAANACCVYKLRGMRPLEMFLLI